MLVSIFLQFLPFFVGNRVVNIVFSIREGRINPFLLLVQYFQLRLITSFSFKSQVLYIIVFDTVFLGPGVMFVLFKIEFREYIVNFFLFLMSQTCVFVVCILIVVQVIQSFSGSFRRQDFSYIFSLAFFLYFYELSLVVLSFSYNLRIFGFFLDQFKRRCYQLRG